MNIEKREDLLKCMRNELVPENPAVLRTGIEGLLEYRMNDNKMHPDSIYLEYDTDTHKYYGRSKTAEYFEALYNVDPFDIGSSDTIFNAWTFLSRFVRGVTGRMQIDEKFALKNVDEIFEGYESVRKKLDILSDYHHCLANFMPAPVGFHGSRSHDGKGNYYRDNDMPDIYSKRH